MSYFVKYDDETVSEAISNHVDSGYESVDEAKTDTFIFEPLGTEFEVINRKGKSYGKFVTVPDGTQPKGN